jgi:hypothetical protein
MNTRRARWSERPTDQAGNDLTQARPSVSSRESLDELDRDPVTSAEIRLRDPMRSGFASGPKGRARLQRSPAPRPRKSGFRVTSARRTLSEGRFEVSLRLEENNPRRGGLVTGAFLFGGAMRPSRIACLRAILRARRIASVFSRMALSDGFS